MAELFCCATCYLTRIMPCFLGFRLIFWDREFTIVYLVKCLMLKLFTLTIHLMEIVRIFLYRHVHQWSKRESLGSTIQKCKLTFYCVLNLNIYADFCTIRVLTCYTYPQHLNSVLSVFNLHKLHLPCPAYSVFLCQSCFCSLKICPPHLDSSVNASWRVVSKTKYAVLVETYLYVVPTFFC